jgi:glucose-6-phosphate dehydrogenase assembly protein OpcA
MKPGQVEQALADLWREASGSKQPVVRTCGLNLVLALTEGDAELAEAGSLVAAISTSVPARALVLTPVPDRAGHPATLDLGVATHSHHTADGVVLHSEQVTIEVPPSGLDLVPATVRQLVVEELPVHVWWRRSTLLGDPLLAALAQVAEHLIADSTLLGPSALAELAAVSSGGAFEGRVADLHWARLEPWREALASFFDDPALRRRLDCVSELALASGSAQSPPPAALYLGGWLASRLGWRHGAGGAGWVRRDGGPARIRFEGDAGVAEGEIGAARLVLRESGSGERACVAQRLPDRTELVLLSVETGGTCPPPKRIKLPPADPAALAARILQRPERDPIYQAALAAACGLQGVKS